MAKRWECSVCEVKFKSYKAGTKHIVTAHPAPTLRYVGMDRPPVSRSLDPDDYIGEVFNTLVGFREAWKVKP